MMQSVGKTNKQDNNSYLTIALIYDSLSCAKIETSWEHAISLVKFSKHKVIPVDVLNINSTSFINYLQHADICFIHYSIVIAEGFHISSELQNILKNYLGYKILSIQDEYRWINNTNAALINIKFDLVLSVAGNDIASIIYAKALKRGIKISQTLTGYVPEPLLYWKIKPYQERTIDVGYRARKLNASYGRPGFEKKDIAQKFIAYSKNSSLITDISLDSKDRLWGDTWYNFLNNCKAVLGTESGAGFLDFDNKKMNEINKNYPHDINEQELCLIEKKYYPYQNVPEIRAISPRVFEAAALKNLQILYEGSYSNILEPWLHYVPLKKDFSNFDQVLNILINPDKAEAIIEKCYLDLVASNKWNYQTYVKSLDKIFEQEFSFRTRLSFYFEEKFLQKYQLSILGIHRYDSSSLVSNNKIINFLLVKVKRWLPRSIKWRIKQLIRLGRN